MTTDLLAQLSAINAAENVQTLWQLHQDNMQAYGFAHLLYGYTRYRTDYSLGDPQDWVVLSSYPAGFMDSFVGDGHIFHAPMVRWAIENEGACSWGLIARQRNSGELSARAREVVAFNASYGIIAGVTISFRHVSNRSRAGIALAGDKNSTQDEIDTIWAEHSEKLIVLNNMMHLKLLTLPYSGTRPLTKRQIEVLQWVGDGKTASDIATLLGLTPATVEKHLRLARATLGVETTAQAVLKAAFFNQMFVVQPKASD